MDTVAIERLTAHSAPARLPVEGEDAREQRNWAIRLASGLPEGWNPNEMSAHVSREAAGAVRAARTARGLAVDDDDLNVVTARVLPLDERHVIVNISTIRLEEDDVHAWLVAASAALTALDRYVPIDDIQGIPRRFWSLVVGP